MCKFTKRLEAVTSNSQWAGSKYRTCLCVHLLKTHGKPGRGWEVAKQLIGSGTLGGRGGLAAAASFSSLLPPAPPSSSSSLLLLLPPPSPLVKITRMEVARLCPVPTAYISSLDIRSMGGFLVFFFFFF